MHQGLPDVSRSSGVETDSRQLTPKHDGRPAIIRDQRTRPANNIDNCSESAKPPSPVQIRAAPPNFRCEFIDSPILRFLTRAVRPQLFSNVLEFVVVAVESRGEITEGVDVLWSMARRGWKSQNLRPSAESAPTTRVVMASMLRRLLPGDRERWRSPSHDCLDCGVVHPSVHQNFVDEKPAGERAHRTRP